VDEKIYLIDNDELRTMEVQPYKSEDGFQKLLEQHPELLAGELIDSDSPRRWMLLAREKSVPDEVNSAVRRWSLDHLFVDQDSIPTLVEVKRSSDTRIRREVVGQMMDYAANAVVSWPIAEIRQEFDADCEKREIDPAKKMYESLGVEAEDVEQFWEKVEANLLSKNIRLLFVADTIPKELKRIIEFLNETMQPTDVFGVELKQYVHEGTRTLVPRVLGVTTAAEVKKKSRSGLKQKWPVNRIKDWLLHADKNAETSAFSRLFDLANKTADRMTPGSGVRPGFGVYHEFEGGSISTWAARSDGQNPMFIALRINEVEAKFPEYPELAGEMLATLISSSGAFRDINYNGTGSPQVHLQDMTDDDFKALEKSDSQLKLSLIQIGLISPE